MRAFVALNLPEATRRALWTATEPLRARDWPVTWVKAEALHVTLKFLGETDEQRAPELEQALHRAARGTKALALVIEGFGAFPDAARPRVLWVGVGAEPALELLQHGLEREYEALGFPVEARAFRPHLTLGRARRDARPQDFRGLGAAFDGVQFSDTVVVDSVDLMRSTLGPTGPIYERVHGERLP